MPLGTEVCLGPGDVVLDGDSSPLKQGGAAVPTYRPMYCGQTAGWIKMPLGTEIGLKPGAIVLDGNPAPFPPLKGAEPLPQFSVGRVCCRQTAGLIKMPLGMEVGLGPGRIVLDRDQFPLPKRSTAPNFRPMSVVAKRLDGLRCHLVRR